MCDKYDNVCTFANNTVSVEVQDGTVIGLDNGDATSVLPYRSSTKPVFHGKLVCVVKPNNNVNNVTITAKSDGLIDGNITVNKSDMTVYTKEKKVFIDATESYEFIGTEYPCESISLNTSSITLNSESSTYQLITTVVPDNCTDIISYETNNNSVAVVDNNGLITSVNDGDCEITVTCGSQTAICHVIVENVSVDCDTITLSETSITLTDKSQHDITATITPENCTYEVSWSSEDDGVVTIDNGGHMTAVADGTTNIIATCGSKSASCSVIVSLEDQPASEWTVEWNGETDSLPVGMTANENCVFILNEETGKYEITTSRSSTEANVHIDDSVGKGIIEIEIESSDFKPGTGWNNGLALCRQTGYRQVLFTMTGNTLYLNRKNAPQITTLNTGKTYKLRLDNTTYNEPIAYKGVDVYVNDDLLYSNNSASNTDTATTSSYLWTTSANTRIKAIRYKKVVE